MTASLDDRRIYGDSIDPDGPWEVGRAECGRCARRWVAVRPFTVGLLECPGCHAMAGRYVAAA